MASRFPSPVYERRIARAAELAAAAGVAGLVITPGPDLAYLIGSDAQTFERLSALVIPATGAPRLVTPRLEVATFAASAAGDLGVGFAPWVDGEDPYVLALAGLPSNPVVAVSDSMSAGHLVPLMSATGTAPMLATDILRDLRMIKDDDEIAALRRAGAAIDRVHARMGEWLRPGRTEAAVAADIADALIAEGHTVAAFVIVGSGPNGADPHHEHSDREITADDIVVIDIGGPVDPGYNSDCTRTYCFAAPPADVARAYAELEAAQAKAVAAVRPGVSAESVDAAARDSLAAAGLADRFIHRTGHGIGLSVHEEPFIVAGNDLLLRPGMAFSVEPGVYFDGQWGARIEDIVIVTDDGCEQLNKRSRALTVLPAQ
ncbi:Xaa-Pro dipeptidase [Gordonia araii NBRC 100433]|uniref:Xaa-Pro dipeptidase n=1 Tax=Gordonia araii NBRC 100433 TaxID=1073574 RepID=G7H7R7_9ACTN|nr:Xaa-Pro peptidase family protein [Gordonia araii]NNG95666.1 aminopeptidase P family protein [Gordonia araii NBRC 100433]GAB11892.1 Xaa-Pro dipeptidase [Gordonia araii NBRC 100433]